MRTNATKLLNVGVIALCGVVLWGGLSDRFRKQTTPRVAFEPGDRIPAAKLIGVERAEKTLVLYTSSEYPFCIESLSFYHRLGEAAKREGIRLVAVSWENPQINKAFLAADGVSVDDTFSLDETHMPLAVTPTLVLIKSNGAAVKTWEGRLDSNDENNVLQFLAIRN